LQFQSQTTTSLGRHQACRFGLSQWARWYAWSAASCCACISVAVMHALRVLLPPAHPPPSIPACSWTTACSWRFQRQMRPVMEGILKGLTKDLQQDARQQRRVEVYVCNKNRQEYSRHLNLAMVAPTLLPIKGRGQTNHSRLAKWHDSLVAPHLDCCPSQLGFSAATRALYNAGYLVCRCDQGAAKLDVLLVQRTIIGEPVSASGARAFVVG